MKLIDKTESIKFAELLKPSEVAAQFADNFGTVWLDSTLTFGDRGCHSYIGINPLADISFQNDEIRIENFSSKLIIQNSGNIYNIVENLVQKENLFAVGYINYESTLPSLELAVSENKLFPQIRFLLFDTILSYNHLNQSFENLSIEQFNLLSKSKNKSAINKSFVEPKIIDSIGKNNYLQKVNQIKEYIKEGDIYQANFTNRFEISSIEHPFEVYKKLRELNPAPYSAYLNFGDYRIISSSPERMFTRIGQDITSGPIKGTIDIGKTDIEKEQNLQKLLHSAKDKAELLMIVDLVRNDLGKIAKTGSVKVDNLFKPEIYSSLIHLVSDISAELKDDIIFEDIVKALLPGGSITGAPKKRAVEIIDELETLPRLVYTGCIGYISKEKADFNIAIRTMYYKDSTYYMHAGGGIVADSDPEAEYIEMHLKAKNMFKALGVSDV